MVYDKAGNNSGFYYPENFTTVGDTTAPTISSVAVVSYSAGCTITVDASDSESGIAEYEYTVLVSNDPIGTTTPNVTSTSNMCNITGLVLGEEYRITVRVIDNQGNAAMAYKYFTVTSNYSYY